MRVLRVYHGGRHPSHRVRDRALVAAGVDVTLVVPAEWPEAGAHGLVQGAGLAVHELRVARAGDVNRHAYAEASKLRALVLETQPDLVDIHEEPFSAVARQVLSAVPASVPVVIYTAQNIDKRFPPPFAQCERAAYRRVTAMYPCSSQAAAVARGKGFSGLIEVLPLGYDDTLFVSGSQSLDADELVIGLVGRLVPEKGVLDAVQVLAMLQTHRPTRLILAGSGPELDLAQKLSARLGVAERLEIRPWQSTSDLAELYRSSHVLLIPSRPTLTWAEQFGRVIVEAQASGAVVAGYASGSIPEVAGDAGLLVPCGAITRLGACIAELIGDPDEFARRRDLGIAQSRERTWTSVGARQAELYRAIIAGDAPSTDLPRSPRARRQFARDQFGPTASALAGQRPFALPVLRRGGRGATGLAQCIDGLGELAARFPRHLGQRDGCRSTATR